MHGGGWRKAAAAILVLAWPALGSCSEESGDPSDQDVRLEFIGRLADSPSIDDDEARCLGRQVVDEGGGDVVRELNRLDEDGAPEEIAALVFDLSDRLAAAARFCDVPEGDVAGVLSGGSDGQGDGSEPADEADPADIPVAADDLPSPTGSEFQDPQGQWQMTIGESWAPLPGTFAAEIEAWGVASMGPSGFTPNVNVLVQEFPGNSPEDYIEVSRRALPDVEASIIETADGRRLARFEFEAPNGLRSLGIAVVKDEVAALATLTAPPGDYPDLEDEVEPFLRTLAFL